MRPDAHLESVLRLCQEACAYNFYGVCINPFWVKTASERLKDSSPLVCTVIGFPLGANSSQTKGLEAQKAISDGANELDMVINIGALKSGNHQQVLLDIQTVVEAAQNRLVKVIIETALLTKEEKTLACQLAQRAKAQFVKTCTGFAGGKATVEDIALMRSVVGNSMGIKASGGIRDANAATSLLKASANRLGTSSGVQIARMIGPPT